MADTEEQKAAEAAKAKAEAEAGKTNEPKMHSDEEFKALIAERDKAKEKVRKIEEAERKAAEEKAIAEGKQNEIIAQQKAELARLAKIEEAHNAQDKALRDSALAKITDEKFKGIAVELSTPKLLELVESISTEKGAAFGGKQTAKETENPLLRKPGESYQQWDARIQQYQKKK